MAREITPLASLREDLILQEEQVVAFWLSLVPPPLQSLAQALADPVRDLVLLLLEHLTDGNQNSREDTRNLAYRVAQRVLEQEDDRVLLSSFRDALQDAVLEHLRLDAEKARRVLGFFSLVTDAYWQAKTDILRRTIRQQVSARLHDELRVAKRVQERLLPKVIPRIPGWEFAGRLKPALEVGGDYWSVKHYAQDGMVTCKLADVTGHGVGAAILVAAVKFISGGFYRGAPSAAWVMERTNHVLVVETPSDIMVTMVYGWIRPATGEVTVVNAGHGSAFVYQNGAVTDIPPTGPALGLLESRYEEVNYLFQPGDLMVLCSDGIVEARSQGPAAARQMFGAARLRELIHRHVHLSASELADQIIDAAVEFSGTPSDDMSLMIVKRVEEPPTREEGASQP